MQDKYLVIRGYNLRFKRMLPYWRGSHHVISSRVSKTYSPYLYMAYSHGIFSPLHGPQKMQSTRINLIPQSFSFPRLCECCYWSSRLVIEGESIINFRFYTQPSGEVQRTFLFSTQLFAVFELYFRLRGGFTKPIFIHYMRPIIASLRPSSRNHYCIHYCDF